MNKNPPTAPPDPYAAHDDVSVKRLALQGHRSAARELVSRAGPIATVTAFFEAMLTADERKRLSCGQFNTLNDQFQEAWRDRQLADTVELPNVSKTNLLAGWGKA